MVKLASRPLSKEQFRWGGQRWIKTGSPIGTPKTFEDKVWDDARIWNDTNLWEE